MTKEFHVMIIIFDLGFKKFEMTTSLCQGGGHHVLQSLHWALEIIRLNNSLGTAHHLICSSDPLGKV